MVLYLVLSEHLMALLMETSAIDQAQQKSAPAIVSWLEIKFLTSCGL